MSLALPYMVSVILIGLDTLHIDRHIFHKIQYVQACTPTTPRWNNNML